jgi:RNA polymerase sigma-70 factor (ECF subfamily)
VRLGRTAEAAEAYRGALALSGNAVEQEFLAERVRGLAADR